VTCLLAGQHVHQWSADQLVLCFWPLDRSAWPWMPISQLFQLRPSTGVAVVAIWRCRCSCC